MCIVQCTISLFFSSQESTGSGSVKGLCPSATVTQVSFCHFQRQGSHIIQLLERRILIDEATSDISRFPHREEIGQHQQVPVDHLLPSSDCVADPICDLYCSLWIQVSWFPSDWDWEELLAGQFSLVWPGARQAKHSLSDMQCEMVVRLESLQTLQTASLGRLSREARWNLPPQIGWEVMHCCIFSIISWNMLTMRIRSLASDCWEIETEFGERKVKDSVWHCSDTARLADGRLSCSEETVVMWLFSCAVPVALPLALNSLWLSSILSWISCKVH